ncbi:hypothetical protein Drorol1_Dr00014886 [Drosera rotundifolia]
MSAEDQESLSAFLPLLREFIPAAAEDNIEADIRSYVSAHERQMNLSMTCTLSKRMLTRQLQLIYFHWCK